MPSGKSKKSKKDVFSIYMHYDGIFITSPLTYAEGSSREINDVNFDGMSLQILYEIVRKLIPGGSNLVKRKRLEALKEKQRFWIVYPSGFQELEVRCGDDSFGVNLQHKVCSCRMWELSGVPCVHVVASYMHLNKDIDDGVSYWYSQEAWFHAYQFSIRPVIGSKYWKNTNHVPPLPPLYRRMPGRPQKQRIKCPTETTNNTHSTQVSRVGRQMTCTNCWTKGHNKSTCKSETQPKPPTERKTAGRKRQPVVGETTSRGGLGSRGGRGVRGGGTATGRGGRTGRGVKGGGMGERGGGRGERGGGRGGTTTSDGHLTAEHVYRISFKLNEEEYVRRCREQEEWEARMDWTHPMNWIEGSNEGSRDGEQFPAQNNPAQATQQSMIHTTNEDVAAVDNGKGKVVDEATDETAQPSKKRNRQKWQEQAYVDGVRIYVKNRGRSERIANRRNKFENLGPGSNPEKALDVSESD
ncbi:zinc finger, PMZ-type containing protein [Tanacetum coccineum]|uniref:Zinc finger, PMZ-type containing protein n=1 Tax=Tanacetum coccineum TaxID=301880 RepID=A0ABQ5C945_9ASTR